MRKLLLAVLLLVPVVALAGQTVKRGPGGGTGSGTAATTTYDPTASGLTATDVQAGIDELAAEKADTDTLAITLIGGVGGVADVKDPNDSNGNRVYDDPIVCTSVDADCSYLSTTTGWWLAMSSNGVTATVWRSITPRADLAFVWREEFMSVIPSGSILHADHPWNYLATLGGNVVRSLITTGYGNMTMNTDTDPAGAVTIYQGAGGATGRERLHAGMTFEASMESVQSCDATDGCQFVIGFCNDRDPAGGYNCVDGVWFEYDYTVSPNWIVNTAVGSSETNVISADVAGSEDRLRWVATASTPALGGAADTVTFYINDVQVGSPHTTNIMQNTTDRAFLMAGLRKTGGTANKFVILNYISLSAYPRHQ